MCTGMIQIFALQINLRTAKICTHPLCIIQTARPVGVVFKQFLQFQIELRIILISVIGFFQFDDCVHQRLRDILSAMHSKSSICSHISCPFVRFQ